ncbi:MAG: DUF4340 domain-containing protein [bacterium]
MRRKNTFITTLVISLLFGGMLAYVLIVEVKGGKRKEEAEEKAKKVLNFDQDKVNEIALTYKDKKEFKIVKVNPDRWQIKQPLDVRASTGVLNSILAELSTAQSQRSVDKNPGDLSAYGLDNSALEIKITLSDKSFQTLQLGVRNPMGATAYAKRTDSAEVFLVSEKLFDLFEKDILWLRDKEVFHFDVTNVSSLIIEQKDKKDQAVDLVRSKDKDEWRIVRPQELKADREMIKDMISALNYLRVDSFVGDNVSDFNPYGLVEPALRVTLKVKNGEETQTLFLGNQKEGKVYARIGDEKSVYLINEDIFKKLNKGVDELRHKKLVELNKYRVKKLSLKYFDKKIILKKEKDGGEWEIVEPVDASREVEYSKVSEILTKISEIKADKFITRQDLSDKEMGFEIPKLEVTLTFEEGDEKEKKEKEQGITIGNLKSKEEGYYAKGSSLEGEVLVKAEEVERLEVDVEGIVEKT